MAGGCCQIQTRRAGADGGAKQGAAGFDLADTGQQQAAEGEMTGGRGRDVAGAAAGGVAWKKQGHSINSSEQ